MGEFEFPPVSFETHPDQYIHWDLEIDGGIATLSMHIKENRPMWEGMYELKLNSYDPAVDIALPDAAHRLRFAHPELRGRIVTRIADNGEGVAPELKKKIFRIFCRGGEELTRQQTGTGLGLYIVRTLVHTLKGRIRVQDRGDQPGSIFEVELPGRVAA